MIWFAKLAQWASYLSMAHVFFQLIRGKRKVEIKAGQVGAVKYKIEFSAGNLQVDVGDGKMVRNVTSVDGEAVAFAVLDLVDGMIPGDQTQQKEWLKGIIHAALQKQKLEAAQALKA